MSIEQGKAGDWKHLPYPATVVQQELGKPTVGTAANENCIVIPELPDYRLTPRGKKVIAGIGVLLCGGFLAAGVGPPAYDAFLAPKVVHTADAYMKAGDGGVGTTCDAANQLAIDNGIDPNKVEGCVEAGQMIHAELNASHPGKVIQRGESFTVELTQNGIQKSGGYYGVNTRKLG